ncbi:MAG: MMPL family transporter [Verrucomicrobiota bacterium]
MLAALARRIYAHAWLIIIATVLGTALAGYLAYANFKILNNISSVLDETSETNRAYLQFKEDFGIDEEYVLVVRGDDPEQNKRAADFLAAEVEGMGELIKQVFYKIDFSPLKPRMLLYEDVESLQQIRAQILELTGELGNEDPALDLAHVLRQTVQGFNDESLRENIDWDEFRPQMEQLKELVVKLDTALKGQPVEPLSPSLGGVEEKAVEAEAADAQAAAGEAPEPEWAKGLPGGGDGVTDAPEKSDGKEVELTSSADIDAMLAEREYVTYLDGKLVLLLATPGVRETDQASPYTTAVARLREIITQVEETFPGVTVGLTGEPVLNDDELQTATIDATRASLITFCLITALFGFSYRERVRPFIAIVVLLLAVVWAFAFSMVFIGHLNIITNAFVPMMLGLGIDFGIQILGRYEEELARGRTVLKALEEALANTGSAVLTSGIITAAAFYTMCFNDFVGLRELGQICGTSLLFCIIVNLIVLPAVFVVRDRKRDQNDLVTQAKRSSIRLPGRLGDKFLSRPGLLTTAGAVITILALACAPYVRFDYNLLNLQNPKLDSVEVEHRLIDDIGTSSLYAAVTVPDLEEARTKTEELNQLYGIKEVTSVADIVPPNQDQRLIYAREITGALEPVELDAPTAASLDATQIRGDLETLLANSQEAVKEAGRYRFSGQAREAIKLFGGLIPPLEASIQNLDTLDTGVVAERLTTYDQAVFEPLRTELRWLRGQQVDRPIGLEDVPTALQKRLMGKDGKLLLQVFSSEDLWEREPLVNFLAQVRSVAPGVTGTPVQNEAYIELLRESYLSAAVWAFAAIVVLIFLHFRRVSYALLAILPLGLGVLWTLGVMAVTGIKFNPANIMTLPMVIGIGVAYGVYTMDRYREEKSANLFATSTGKSIVLSALTTIIAFGSMLTASYTGLKSMGQVMTLGVFMCLLTSIVFLPQLLVLLKGREPKETPKPEPTDAAA